MPADFFCSHRLVLSGVILGRVLLLIWENSDRIEHMIRLWLYNILRELLKNRAAFAEKKHAQFCMWRAREVFSLLLSRFWENILLFDEVIQTHFLCMCCNVDISMEYELQIRQMLHFQSPFIIISFIFLLFIFCMYCYLIIAPLFQLSKSDIALLMILSFTLGLLCHLFHPIQSQLISALAIISTQIVYFTPPLNRVYSQSSQSVFFMLFQK